MTELDAQLFHQASILALLPDLVIVTNVEGVITFCSAQVERVLGHKIDHLMGAKLTDLIVPSSRETLVNLIAQLVESEQKAEGAPKERADKKEPKSVGGKDQEGSSSENTNSSGSMVSSSGAAAVASFPLSVVKIGLSAASYENETSDRSGTGSDRDEKTLSSLTNSASRTRSPNSSLQGNSGTDDSQHKCAAVTKTKAKNSSSDSCNSSSLSANAKRLQKANANLERNVRWHNKKVKDRAMAGQLGAGYKDDAIGADFTANNAAARLPSSQHPPQSSSSDEDSGYRESNDSREETSTSPSDNSSKNRRRKPLAPTCNVCLVRHDLTTIWCEVTSSIRTRNLREESKEMILEDAKPQSDSSRSNSTSYTKSSSAPTTEGESQPTAADEDVKELLLCLRPLRHGEEKLEETFRPVQPRSEPGKRAVSSDSNSGPSSGMASRPSATSQTSAQQSPEGPSKRKRPPSQGSSDDPRGGGTSDVHRE